MIGYSEIDNAMSEGMAARGSKNQSLADAIALISEDDQGWIDGETMYASMLDIDMDGLTQYGTDFAENATGQFSIAALHEVHPEATPWQIVYMIVASAFVTGFTAGVQAHITSTQGGDAA